MKPLSINAEGASTYTYRLLNDLNISSAPSSGSFTSRTPAIIFNDVKTKNYNKMSTTINYPILVSHEIIGSLRSLVNRFLDWSSDQQENRLGWQGISLIGFGCFFTPLVVLLISLSGANLFLILTALIAMEVNLVANLTTMPTKITIPVFFLTALTDLIIIIVSVIAVI